MADNIGKVQILIEAQTKELKKGLASAEQQVKTSAKKMEQSTTSLAQRVGKSYTEFASKLSVISQVGDVAEKVWKGVDAVLTVVTNKTLSAGQKLTGTMEAVEQAGIPVVSQFLAIGHGIHDWISGEAQLSIAIDKRRASSLRAWHTERAGLKSRQERRQALQDATAKGIQLLEEEASVLSLGSDQARLALKQEHERLALRKKFNEQIEIEKKSGWIKENINEAIAEFEKFMRLVQERQDRELQVLRAKEMAKTKDLQTQLKILEAQQAGNVVEARRIAIRSKYEKMRLNATKEQLKLLQKMEQIELAGVAGKPKSSPTASISTAIGSFTVAQGNQEQKKQTSLLAKISNSSDKVAKAVSRGTGIILPR